MIWNVRRRLRILLSLCMLLCVCGCGKTASMEPSSPAADMRTLQESMLAADMTLPRMLVVTSEDDRAEVNFTAFSDFDYSKVRSYFYAYAADGGAQEIVVVELKDASDAAMLMDSYHEHLKLRQGGLSEYAPDQLPMVEHAVIKQKGNLVAMIICEKSGLVQKAFEE